MTKREKVLFAFVIILSFLIIFNRPKEKIIEHTDIEKSVDTILIPNPVKDTAYIDHYINVKIPVIETDTVDSIVYADAEIPIEKKVYKDSTYDAVISGFQPNLDTIKVFPVTYTITKEIIVNKPIKRWNWGIVGGVGYGLLNKKPDFFIGIGGSYKF